jgi:hypothetical protein
MVSRCVSGASNIYKKETGEIPSLFLHVCVKLLPAKSGPVVDNALHYQQALRAKDLHVYMDQLGKSITNAYAYNSGKSLTGFSNPILSHCYTNGVRREYNERERD